MGIESVLASIDAEISKLQEARRLLSGVAGGGDEIRRKPGPKPRKKRNLTPEGRARIAAAVKARWERQKSGKKK